MKFKGNIFENYLKEAPLPLAMERWLECEIYQTKSFEHPILDIGCGEGMFAHILFGESIDVGIDPNSRELERATEYGAYTELINCFGDNIPKPDKSFNTIFSNSVLEHIPKIDDVLKEAHRLLADNGKMYATIPTDMFDKYSVLYQLLSFLRFKSLSERYRIFFNNFWAHYHFYDEKGWRNVFERNGFKIVEAKEYAGKKICLTNDFLAPFSIIAFISKKFTNKWFVCQPIRRPMSKLLTAVYSGFLHNSKSFSGRGGLIFFELEKQEA